MEKKQLMTDLQKCVMCAETRTNDKYLCYNCHRTVFIVFYVEKITMRIFDLYSKVAELPDGEYFFVNKNFFSWKICVIKKDYELSKKYFYQGTEELDFEETSEKYRFFCAMMQSDDWEILQSKNKKSENKKSENKNV